MDWNYIANISSIITLVLFVISIIFSIIHFIGRLWAIHNTKKIDNEHFKMLGLVGENSIIDEVFPQYICDLGGEEINKFRSNMYINKFKVFKIEYINGDYSKWKKVSKKPKYVYKGLNSNEKIYIKLNLPCGGPTNYLIEYTRYDYVKISFIPCSNGINTDLSQYCYKRKMTIPGYLYYFFQG